MLANNTFAVMKKEAIRRAKFIIKEEASLLPKTSIKLSSTWIQLTSYRDITLSQHDSIGYILLIKNYKASTTSSGQIV